MGIEAFAVIARQWLETARHPRFDRPYTELVFQPMLELLACLRENGFQTWIVSGRRSGVPAELLLVSQSSLGVEPSACSKEKAQAAIAEAKSTAAADATDAVKEGAGKALGDALGGLGR